MWQAEDLAGVEPASVPPVKGFDESPPSSRPIVEFDAQRMLDLTYTELMARLEDPVEMKKITAASLVKLVTWCESLLHEPAPVTPARPSGVTNILVAVADRGLPAERIQALADMAIARLPELPRGENDAADPE